MTVIKSVSFDSSLNARPDSSTMPVVGIASTLLVLEVRFDEQLVPTSKSLT
jgi:hypothetical protein